MNKIELQTKLTRRSYETLGGRFHRFSCYHLER